MSEANWFPLHCHSHFSLLDGLSKPEQIADRVAECGFAGSAITDHGNVSAGPGFLKVMQKKKLKAILGCEFYVCETDASIKTPENASLNHLVVLAKNMQGWKNLMRASTTSFRPENFYKKARLSLEQLSSFSNGQFICFSGHPGSELADICFTDRRLAYSARTYEDAKALVRKDWKEVVCAAIHKFRRLFGDANFWVEIQLIDQANLPASLVVARILRHCAKLTNTPTVATADSHYCRKEDAADQRVLLCSLLETTMKEVQRKIDADEEVGLGAFFKSNNYHIPTLQEMQELHSEYPEELANSCRIADQCEEFKLGGKPMFPDFPFLNGRSPDDFLEDWCKKGWSKLVEGKIKQEKVEEYRARLWEKELPVIRGTDGFLANYFLVTADIIRHAREKLKVRTGKGRGSAAGSIVAWLTGITRVDPVRFDLLFERFYNAGRNSPGHIALPDIDSDFPIAYRDQVINYIRETYGHDKVAQMATFSRMQGRGAIKDVLRAHDRVSFEEMNRITEFIPDEAEISDQLQEMREETGEASIIQWALENNAEQLKQWAWLKEDGELDGPLALDFAQAIRLEGTKRGRGKHASGVIICDRPLSDVCPLIYERGGDEPITAIDMKDCDSEGLCKIDILGTAVLDKLDGAEQLIRTGRFK